jgi:hypothetical protein
MLVVAALVLPGVAFAADVTEYRDFLCEPLTPKSEPYTIQCPYVNGLYVEEACVCPDTVTVVTVPPTNASPM